MISTFLLRADKALASWSDGLLTAALLFLAIVLVIIAFHGRPLLKAGALAWVVLP